MPKKAKELSALAVSRLKHPDPDNGEFNAYYAVGGVAGLMLQITPNGGRSWVLRTTVASKRRNMGLGSYPEITLEAARNSARNAKATVRDGRDPIVERKEKKATLVAEQKSGMTFTEALAEYLPTKLASIGSEKNRKALEATINTYAKPELGRMLIRTITVQDVLRILTPIWNTKTQTAMRLRAEIENLLAWATVHGRRSGDNPARWGGNLALMLPRPSKVITTENHPAIALTDATAWFQALRGREGTVTRALEFIALNASRSGEVRGMKRSEYDTKAKIWTVPAARMKMRKEHRIPLSDEAIAIIEQQSNLDGSEYVFPSPTGGMLVDASLSSAMRRMIKDDGKQWTDPKSGRPAVPHGLRSTFRDYIGEKTTYPSEMAELALAHTVGDKVEAAYRRSDMLEKRRHMMQDWANFLHGNRAQSDNVIDMTTATKKRA
ncbi:integrase arm-type DNA-binding domain-containing protein [Bradyrhizobium sp. SSUT18]|uniref:tyrosine-type recombinase/integrase n=1 Tax=Bradyrhizobium sp. SSUT18 TaxID=3040602 RepID=UPI0024473AEA|nr:site-specific integrase [Bradyrhizobium sp. SSUT18]MDH2403659.1 integrase arm-type DNA-binding domain-containing protein [Bradyrhizobium sp. SSUT18]